MAPFFALVVAVFLAFPLYADEAAPPSPEAVAQQFLETIRRVEDLNVPFDLVRPFVLPGPEQAEVLPGPEQADMTLLFISLHLMWANGDKPLVNQQGDTMTLDLPVRPLRLVLRQVDGEWKVDLGATYNELPEPLRRALEKHMRPQAQQTGCLSNLRQIAAAAHMFARDHDGRLPDADKWMDELAPYLNNEAILKCPAAPDLEWGYAMNAALSGEALAAIPDPEKVVLFFDSKLGTRNAAGGVQAVAAPGRHNGGNIYAFADGHVKWCGQPPFDALAEPGQQGAGGPPPGD
jgi:prepilin-type processing-associated H-X9-DG protein